MAVGLRLRQYVFRRDEYRCVYCGAEPPRFTLQADHVVPRAKGGATHPANLVTACFCNGSKSGLSLQEWAQRLEQEIRRADKRRRALQTVRAMLEREAFERSAARGADPEIDAILDRVPMPKAA